MPTALRPLFTIGHSTHPAADLIAILRAWRITRLVDIRTVPRSRTNPQFNADTFPETLGAADIAYVRLAELGGLRGKSKDAPTDRNAGWENASFRNYADYAGTEAFRAGLRRLLAMAAREPTAIMCAEAVWWRCHRRIVSDHAIALGVPVVHLFSAEKGDAATLTPFAVLGPDASVTYPAA